MIHVDFPTHVALQPGVWSATMCRGVSVLLAQLEIHFLLVSQVCLVLQHAAGFKSYLLNNFCFLVKQGECSKDTDCPDTMACFDNQCLDPCQVESPCGTNAQCSASAHRPVCRCPAGWAGHPSELCYQRKTLSAINFCRIEVK